jgi:hypothetical protein
MAATDSGFFLMEQTARFTLQRISRKIRKNKEMHARGEIMALVRETSRAQA